jgi:tetratricopeptide (TPR) repeat protein
MLLIWGTLWVCGAAQAQYAAKITVRSGNSFVVDNLNIQGDRLVAKTGSSSTSLSMIKSIEFRFSGLGLKTCETLFRTGDRKALEGLIDMHVGPVAKYTYLPTNLGDYLVWQARTQYWNGNRAGFGKTAGLIRQASNQGHIDVVSLYFAVQLLDQGKLSDAKQVFGSVESPESVSVAMTEYILGKIAMDEGRLRDAMKSVARIIAFHGRNTEWMPPATVLEARIYQQLGQPEKATAVANELLIAYPGSRWSELGKEIMKESTGTAGG